MGYQTWTRWRWKAIPKFRKRLLPVALLMNNVQRRCPAWWFSQPAPAPPNLVQLSAGDMEGERAGTGGEAEPTV